MAGIKIHQYPLERTSIGDDDYYDIDYWTGSSYQSAKIKGSTLKNVLGADYIDITTFISGYDLTDKDAGKLITNSNTNFRTLVIPSGLALPNNMITVKGRIAIQPEIGVNITLPDGSIITDPTQFTCLADEVYILHKSAFTGDNYILVSVKKSENIGTNDLIITDTIRELQVATDGTLQIVTNDANNSAIFRVGDNSNERFSEIEFNTVIFDLLSKFQNPSITAGVIVEVNPNEFKFIVLPDTSNTSVYHGLIKADANKTIIEKSNAGKFMFDSSLSINTFEDLRVTKKGLEYSADYSANFSVRSLVDKGYVDSNSLYTNNGTTGSNRTVTITDVLNFNGGKFALNSTTAGFLMPRVTTLQMNGIATPSTNELVFNTDLNGLYRYNGSSWVALSSGYGIIGVYSGSGSGAQTFFADLQSALETCKASGGYFTVKLYSNITITSAIEIDYTGSGVGNAYLFRQLTIDFNGFSVTNAQADTSEGFDVRLSNSAAVYQEIRFINGGVFRTNGTGTHHALKCDTAGRYGTIQMSKMYWYCQNGFASSISLGQSTEGSASLVCDLGESTFVSQTTTAMRFILNSVKVNNFNAISKGSSSTINNNGSEISNFITENTSTGYSLYTNGASKINNFKAISNSGDAVYLDGNSQSLDNFTIFSTSGVGLNAVNSNATINNFFIKTGNNRGLYYQGAGGNISNGKVINNSNLQAVFIQNAFSAHNVEGINEGSGSGIDLRSNSTNNSMISNCKGMSIGGWGAYVNASSTGKINVDKCNFISRWNNAGGNGLWVEGIGTIYITNSHFEVVNASANAIYATSAVTVRSRYCTHNDVATTPINANVTIVSSGIIS